jgi:hypothetical protein
MNMLIFFYSKKIIGHLMIVFLKAVPKIYHTEANFYLFIFVFLRKDKYTNFCHVQFDVLTPVAVTYL